MHYPPWASYTTLNPCIISQTRFFQMHVYIMCTGNTYIASLSESCSSLLSFYGRFRGPRMTEVNIFHIQALYHLVVGAKVHLIIYP